MQNGKTPKRWRRGVTMADELISREAVFDAFRAYMVEHFDKDKCAKVGNCEVCEKKCLWHEVVASVPSIDPESLRPKGKWIKFKTDEDYWYYGGSAHWFKCSECDEDAEGNVGDAWYSCPRLSNFCPNCGADMRGNADDN